MAILLIVMTGLMAGIYFAFSVVVMRSLAELPAALAAQTMNKINDVIVKTVFLPMFIGSTLWYAVLAVQGVVNWQNGQSLWVISAALIYCVGMFGVTAFGNVPLNNRLKESEVDEAALITTWEVYLRKWTRLNHLRTVSCVAALVLLSIATA